MLIYLLAFVGGVLTILSPCILPVLPFVFSRADQPFRRSGLPLLTGMALTFALVATAAAFGGHWVVRLNQGGRYVAIAVFLVLGLTLLFPSLAEATDQTAGSHGRENSGRVFGGDQRWKIIRVGNFYRIALGALRRPYSGSDIDRRSNWGARRAFIFSAVILCIGRGDFAGTALLAGKKVFSAMKRSLSFDVWIRRALGVAVLVGVVAIALGWDTGLLKRFSFVNTAKAEEHLIGTFGPKNPTVVPVSTAETDYPRFPTKDRCRI